MKLWANPKLVLRKVNEELEKAELPCGQNLIKDASANRTEPQQDGSAIALF